MYGPMLRGINEADSITVDPHKWFYMPFAAGGILVREGDFLRKSFLVHPEYYMEKVLQDGDDAGRSPTTNGHGRRVIRDRTRISHRGDKVNFFQYGDAGQPAAECAEGLDGLQDGRSQAIRRLGGEGHRAGADLGRPHATASATSGSWARTPWASAISVGSRCDDARASCASVDEVNDQLNRDLQERVEREGDAWFSYHRCCKGRVALRVNVENR